MPSSELQVNMQNHWVQQINKWSWTYCVQQYDDQVEKGTQKEYKLY